MASTEKEYHIALKEIELLNIAIGRQEDIGLKIRGWCITLITALTVAFFSNELRLSPSSYFGISFFVIILFFCLEVSHRIAELNAIKRSRYVEKIIRWKLIYWGPKISVSMIQNKRKMMLKAFRNGRILPTYLFLLIFILIATWLNTECPLPSLDDWMQDMKCPYTQIACR